VEAVIPHLSLLLGTEHPSEGMYAYVVARTIMATTQDPVRLVEVGCYGGRLTMPMACAVLGTHHKMTVVDSFKGYRDKDADTLDVWQKKHRSMELETGVDLRALMEYHLRVFGLNEQVNVVAADPESAGKTWGAVKETEKIDFLVLNNLPTYKELLTAANAWLPYLRNGRPVLICNGGSEAGQAVVRELVMVKKWKVEAQIPSGGRLMILLSRPLDETSGPGVKQ
jgi:hypothetical protein